MRPARTSTPWKSERLAPPQLRASGAGRVPTLTLYTVEQFREETSSNARLGAVASGGKIMGKRKGQAVSPAVQALLRRSAEVRNMSLIVCGWRRGVIEWRPGCRPVVVWVDWLPGDCGNWRPGWMPWRKCIEEVVE